MFLLRIFLGCMTFFVGMINADAPQYVGYSQEIPESIAVMMNGLSWKPECPVPLSDLRYLTISHWGYDDMVHEGHMVVHAKIAEEIVAIFRELFEQKFPIERMEIIDLYGADDDRSMEANNSSAFCCRAVTNVPGLFSNHSYGIAIDINPLVNPYIKGAQVLPASGRAYIDRTRAYKGMITDAPNNPCYKAFSSRGYEWGGHFVGRTDYQHFSKQISDIT